MSDPFADFDPTVELFGGDGRTRIVSAVLELVLDDDEKRRILEAAHYDGSYPASVFTKPTPIITDVAPPFVNTGVVTTLTVSGQFYTGTSYVRADGLALSTTFISTNTLEARFDLPTPAGTIVELTVADGPRISNPWPLGVGLPHPIITSVVPDVLYESAATPASLQVLGVGFESVSVVHADGVALPTVYVSATELTATYLPDVLGAHAVTVVNNLQTSDPFPITVEAWTPLALGDCVGWWDGDDATTITYSSGIEVSEWADKSPSDWPLANSVIAEQPQWSGKIAYDYLTMTYLAGSLINVGNVFTLFIVLRAWGPAPYTQWLCSDGAQPYFAGADNPNSYVSFGTGSTVWAQVAGLDYNADVLYAIVLNNADQKVYRNGVLIGTTPSVSGAFRNVVTGYGLNKSDMAMSYRAYQTNLYEMFVCAHAATPAEQAASETYLRYKWQPPTITALERDFVFVGDAMTLSVTGMNFTSSSIVHLDGVPVATTYVSGTELTIEHNLAAGVYQVTVVDGPNTSNALPLTSEIPVLAPDPFAHWDASDAASFTYSSGAVVSQWADLSAADSNDLGQTVLTKQPGRTALVNGLDAVRHDGVDDVLPRLAGALIPQPITILAVWHYHTGTGAHIWDGGASRLGFFNTNGAWSMYAGAPINGGILHDTVPRLATLIYNGATSELRRDRVSLVTGDVSTNGMDPAWALARGDRDDGPFVFAEVVAYPRVITGHELDSAEAFLKVKWGTP